MAIHFTGKRYGLKVTSWVDERRDPEKSTLAAARYLKDLHDTFGCWYLAAASYNAGEAKLAIGMKRYGTKDFWKLAKYRYLKQETKDYVPQMIAAILIAKEPEKYGFLDIKYQDPLCYHKVKVPQLTDLTLIAKACDISVKDLKDLNPELRRGFTPPNTVDYEVKIPCERKELFFLNFKTVQPARRVLFKNDNAKKRKTVTSKARLHR